MVRTSQIILVAYSSMRHSRLRFRSLPWNIVYLQKRRTFVAPTKIIVVMPGETEENPSITIDLPADEMKQAVDQGASSSETTLVRLGGPVAFANFVIRQPGAIKVRAVRDSTLIRLGSLQVVEGQQTVAPEEAAN